MAKSVLAPSFLFQFAVPFQYREKVWSDKPLDFSDEYRLRGFGDLDSRKQFADVRGAWNERGVSFSVLVSGKRQPTWCRESRVDESDGFQIWIDTRATHNVHRATRFCHRFAFLPSGGGSSYRNPVGDQLLINRARENANPVRPGDLRVRGQITADGYLLECCVPATSLTGYDPVEYPKLGFFYAVMDRELGWQTQSVNTQFPIDEDPSVWCTLEMAKPKK